MQSTNYNNHIVYTDTGGLFMKASKERRVFIVEDNEMHSMMMDYLLSKDNSFQIIRFKSGEECLQKLYVHPDIIILDYGLPGMNGLQTFEQIKKYDSNIPVVVVTESRDAVLEQQFLRAGVHDYIIKEQNAFDKLSGIIDKVFEAVALKEHSASNRLNLPLVAGFMLLIILSSIISYIVFKH